MGEVGAGYVVVGVKELPPLLSLPDFPPLYLPSKARFEF